jgi:hypothetical protein
MKKSLLAPRHTGLAILAGALTFMGNASAVTIFSEGFEGGSGAGNAFGAGTYAYSLNYTLPNTLTPSGGTTYGTGDAAATTLRPAANSPFSLLTGGITGPAIDAGTIVYSLSAQFSTYTTQNDFGQIRVTFLDGGNAPLGSPVVIGSLALVSGLGSGQGGPPFNIAGVRDWAADTATGAVPVGARSASVEYLATRFQGTAADGYVDNVSLDIDVVPEPSTALTALLGGVWLMVRRPRRE